VNKPNTAASHKPGPIDFALLDEALAGTAVRVDKVLDGLLPRPSDRHGRVQEAMRYAVFAGGKRLRPFLVQASASLFGISPDGAMRTAAAIEVLHAYSLVHDDLPCMDDDVLRRGKPTTHVRFDEATAVLAGDGLLTLAFEILADSHTHASPVVRCQLVAGLARAAGSEGMVGGQMVDMLAPEHVFDAKAVINLQRMKTGALFEFACEAGPILGQASPEAREIMRAYARDFGLIFQITDDLIDAESSAGAAGKSVGKDRAQGKATLVSIFGVEGARAKAAELADQAALRLAGFGPEAAPLRSLPFRLLDRDR
jgi:farnesyl diphosphate synthase